MRNVGFAILLLGASIPFANAETPSPYLVDERPCPDQDPRLRPPRQNEWCDYVTKIQTCNGDLAERIFRQPNRPAYLTSELGVNHPRRLICHEDD